MLRAREQWLARSLTRMTIVAVSQLARPLGGDSDRFHSNSILCNSNDDENKHYQQQQQWPNSFSDNGLALFLRDFHGPSRASYCFLACLSVMG